MSVPGWLTACAGRWSGVNTLQDPNLMAPEDSPATAAVAVLLGGRFVRIDYTWAYRGKPQEGSLLIGGDAKTGTATAHWIDAWHNGDNVMACVGTAVEESRISLRGSYAAPPGPDWGWRIDLLPGDASNFRMVMFNIWPDGREDLAVESAFSR